MAVGGFGAGAVLVAAPARADDGHGICVLEDQGNSEVHVADMLYTAGVYTAEDAWIVTDAATRAFCPWNAQ